MKHKFSYNTESRELDSSYTDIKKKLILLYEITAYFVYSSLRNSRQSLRLAITCN